MEKYKNALVLGKFTVLHKGHLLLINTAIENSEKVNIMLCYNHSQEVPGRVRLEAMRKIYGSNPKVEIHFTYDGGLPQHESDTGGDLDLFYNYWVPFVNGFVREKLDVVFTSEHYGDDFARYLGIEHYLVDLERKKYNVSSTKIRNNPHENWDYVPDEMKHFFIKRVALMGPESVGKSTLTKNLAKYYDTNFVEEYGRNVCEETEGKISLSDFVKISLGREDMETELIKKSNKFIFCDTEDLTTYVFLKLYYPDSYKRIEMFFKDRIRKNKKYDLYILLKPDVAFVQDATRDADNDRDKHYEMIKKELIDKSCNFVEVGGNWDKRFEKAIEYINNI
jgi:HTH-type transcriptional repressor of NAD biosynthesis genes